MDEDKKAKNILLGKTCIECNRLTGDVTLTCKKTDIKMDALDSCVDWEMKSGVLTQDEIDALLGAITVTEEDRQREIELQRQFEEQERQFLESQVKIEEPSKDDIDKLTDLIKKAIGDM